jgi:hypothetical protein
MMSAALDPELDPLDAPLPPRPYPGLRPFESDEWPIFFGRETMTEEVIRGLVHQQLVVVHGDSGCGKSSLIRAGVLARLAQGHVSSGLRWRTCKMLPRENPLGNLVRALAELDGAGDVDRHEIHRVLNHGADAPAGLAELLRRGVDDHICILVDQSRSCLHSPDSTGAMRLSCSSTSWSASRRTRRPACTRS